MRVIGGRLRGKRLVSPKGLDTRPTTDRVRESLFNILENKQSLSGLRVLDLFAGTGALGIETLSRGGSFCLFVEEASPARAAIHENVENLQLTGQTKIFRRDATRLGAIGTIQPFDMVFADPPYGRGMGERAAKSLIEGGWLCDNAVLILEEQISSMPEKLDDFNLLDSRSYGDTAIAMFELSQQ
ncbi:MAG: 16S rRNA (guanine(966)-N(2))-methyltransferase RsmD [Pseudomonadota bacterium]